MGRAFSKPLMPWPRLSHALMIDDAAVPRGWEYSVGYWIEDDAHHVIIPQCSRLSRTSASWDQRMRWLLWSYRQLWNLPGASMSRGPQQQYTPESAGGRDSTVLVARWPAPPTAAPRGGSTVIMHQIWLTGDAFRWSEPEAWSSGAERGTQLESRTNCVPVSSRVPVSSPSSRSVPAAWRLSWAIRSGP